MRDVVSEIKAKIDILQLVSEYVVLKKSGSYYKGLSPFKPEKTPSFIVSPEKGIAYCFATNKGGDIFTFIQEVENIEFAEALKLLAEKAGVEMDQKDYQQSLAGKKSEKQELIDLHEQVAKFYQAEMWNSDEGAKVIKYMEGRGITQETIKTFGIGYAPDSFDKTYLFLMKQGFSEKQILSAGLVLRKETGRSKIYDRFRGRLMFPVFDHLGRTVGFGGRALAKDQEPKYLNSPETIIYQKSNLLYGFNLTKQEVKKADQVLVVEGYMDVIAAYQNGIKWVVGVNGTALTVKQLASLKSYTKNLVLGFDMDSAGREAASRGFELAQEFDFIIRILELPEGKDIADYCKSHDDALEILKKPQLFTDYYYGHIMESYDKESLADKKKILADFAEFVSKLKSSMEKDEYIRKLAMDLGLETRLIFDEVQNYKMTRNRTEKKSLEQEYAKIFEPQEILIGLILEFPELCIATKLDFGQDFFPENLKNVYNIIVDHYNQPGIQKDCNTQIIISNLDQDIRNHASVVSLYAKEKYSDLSAESVQKEIEDLYNLIISKFNRSTKHRLHRQLQEAEAAKDQTRIQEILKELSSLH